MTSIVLGMQHSVWSRFVLGFILRLLSHRCGQPSPSTTTVICILDAIEKHAHVLSAARWERGAGMDEGMEGKGRMEKSGLDILECTTVTGIYRYDDGRTMLAAGS